MTTAVGWICSLVTVCHTGSQQHTSREKFDVSFVSENAVALTALSGDGLFFLMIIESASASPDVITLVCLCWHVEGWNIVIEMHYHPSLNWDQSQAGLCKWTLIWESVCPGQRASGAKKSWLGSSHSEPKVSGSSSGEHVSVSMLELLCIFAPDSLHHPFGNRGGNWGICQHRHTKVVISSSLIVLQIQCNGPCFKNNHNANQSRNDLSHLCIFLFFYHIRLAGYSLACTHRRIHKDTEREGDTQSLAAYFFRGISSVLLLELLQLINTACYFTSLYDRLPWNKRKGLIKHTLFRCGCIRQLKPS